MRAFLFLCLKIHQAKAGARQPQRGECSAGNVYLLFLKSTLSRQRGAQPGQNSSLHKRQK